MPPAATEAAGRGSGAVEPSSGEPIDGGMALGWVVALAVGAGVGAWLASPLPLAVGIIPALAGWGLRRPVLLVTGVALLACGLGARAVAGLGPVATGPFAGTVELVTDPEPAGRAGWRAEVRLPDGRRVRASAHGTSARPLQGAHAGARLDVEGRLRPLGRRTAWSDSRHLVGSLTIERAGVARPGSGLSQVAEAVRSRVEAGSERLPSERRPLYTGLVVGDDRFQAPAQQAAFRAAGLTHLLAVSGQNVAFVLLALGPLLRRLTVWPRMAAVASVLVVFAAVTRFEPSVLRATTTAGIAAWSVALGRPNRGIRTLALAVTALVLIDPLLVRSVGFQLSVLASVGILVLGPSLQRVVPGPGWFREPLVVTASAQLAVLPLLAAVFGPVSVAAVPANLAVSAAAGLVMTWGLTVGVVAGMVPPVLGEWLQLPASWALWWIDVVAGQAAAIPAPRVGLWAVPPLFAAVGGLVWAPARRRLAVVLVVGVMVLAPSRSVDRPLPGARWCPGGASGWDVLVLDDPSRPTDLLEVLLERGVRRVDVVVATGGGRAHGAAVGQLAELVPVGPVLAPPVHQIRGATRVTAPVELPGAAGPLWVTVDGRDRLAVSGRCGSR